MNDEFADDLTIETLVRAVSEQLLQSQQNRIAGGQPALFEVTELTLDISFVVGKSRHGGGGFDLKVVRADGGVQYDTQSVQKVTLKLAALRDQPQPFGGFGPVRPRRVEQGGSEDD
jgi:hypothetical protein